jgi:hypothetical protein
VVEPGADVVVGVEVVLVDEGAAVDVDVLVADRWLEPHPASPIKRAPNSIAFVNFSARPGLVTFGPLFGSDRTIVVLPASGLVGALRALACRP